MSVLLGNTDISFMLETQVLMHARMEPCRNVAYQIIKLLLPVVQYGAWFMTRGSGSMSTTTDKAQCREMKATVCYRVRTGP